MVERRIHESLLSLFFFFWISFLAMEKQWDEPPVYRWFFNLRDSQGRVVARITGKFQRNKVSLKITLAWEACERWWRYNKWGRRGWSGPWWRHLIKIGGGGEAISGEPPDDRVSILNYALMATRELTGIGQAYQIPVPSSLNFGNRSSIVTYTIDWMDER